MSRPTSREAKTRLNIDLPERTMKRLDRLQEQTEAESRTEVVRRAIAVYAELVAVAQDEEGRIVLRPKSGGERELVLK